MSDSSATILERFRVNYGKDIDLTLRPAYRELLEKFGNPQNHLPAVFHVAGTNGKGSTCAFLRAILEATGARVHVYTSPHLVTFYERIRIAGQLIEEDELKDILSECETYAKPGTISYFEVATLAAFIAFTRHPADYTILETGLGGRLDATNVVDKPLATIITRLSFDHREYLGETINKIAKEKAGIMRKHIPCFVAPQPDVNAILALRDAARSLETPLLVGGEDWKVEDQENGFHFEDKNRSFDLPAPALLGKHQYLNAGLAIAALGVLPSVPSLEATIKGLKKVEWPGRLQSLKGSRLTAYLSDNTELWLDGGHNDSAGEVLAQQIESWRTTDGANSKPLYVVMGMLTTKYPEEFLSPFAKAIKEIRTVAIPDEALSFSAASLAEELHKCGLTAKPSDTLIEALKDLRERADGGRILICGSLYLAGIVLKYG